MTDLCKVERLVCASNLDRLTELKGLAAAQLAANSSEFEEPYPWDFDFCKYRPSAIHIVAVSGTTICGWATVSIETYGSTKTLELEAITTRRKRMGEQRIGKMLHNEIVRLGQSEDVACLFLHAANESVASVYGKWGYKKVFEDGEIADLEEKTRKHAELMMYYPFDADLKLAPRFKEMILRDAMELATTESYGGNYRHTFKGGGRRRRGSRRSHRARNTRRRRPRS